MINKAPRKLDDFSRLEYYGLEVTKETAREVADRLRGNGKRAVYAKLYIVAARCFAGALFAEMFGESPRWSQVMELHALIGAITDCRITDDEKVALLTTIKPEIQRPTMSKKKRSPYVEARLSKILKSND